MALDDLCSRSVHIQKLHNLYCVTVPLSLLVIFGQIEPATPTSLYISGLLGRSNKIMRMKTPHKQGQRNDTNKCTGRRSGPRRVPLPLEDQESGMQCNGYHADYEKKKKTLKNK